MTISDGSTIESADLDALGTAQLALLRADNAQLPLAHEASFVWVGLTASSADERCKAVFVMPFDGWLETLVVQGSDFTAASSVTVSLTCPGVLTASDVDAPDPFPVSVTGAVGAASRTKLSRVIYDGTKGRVGTTHMASNRAIRLIPKGATVTINVQTTSVVATSMLQVLLLLRGNWARS